MPDGRAANQPSAVVTFSPPSGAPLPGAVVSFGGDRLAGQLGGGDLLRGQLGQPRLLLPVGRGVDAGIDRRPVLGGQLGVALRRRRPGDRQDLRGQQGHDDPVLVGGPHRAVAAQERRARRLLATETDCAADQPVDEPLEADGHLDELAAQAGHHPVDDRRADGRLADGHTGRPVRPVRVEVVDRDGQIVVRVHQPGVGGDDAVPVGVGVVAGGDLIGVAVGDQRRHRVR